MSYTPIAIKQNGIVVGYANKSINFTGGLLEVSSNQSGHTFVSISNNLLSSTNYIVREIPERLNDSFVLKEIPLTGTEMVFLNGMLLTAIDDYTIQQNDITFIFSIYAEDQVHVTYFH